jgi:hypothetical protein
LKKLGQVMIDHKRVVPVPGCEERIRKRSVIINQRVRKTTEGMSKSPPISLQMHPTSKGPENILILVPKMADRAGVVYSALHDCAKREI